MKVLAVLAAALALVPGTVAGGYQTAVLSPIEDVSMPFMCNWGYDWDDRCYRDNFDRLAFPSSSYADPAQRPRLVVDYMS